MKPVLTLTARAVQRISTLLSHKPEFDSIRVGLKERGCNGLTYTMNYGQLADKQEFDEVVPVQENLNLVIESKAVMFILGTTLDYKEDLISQEFVFDNPNKKGDCGCGQSFNV